MLAPFRTMLSPSLFAFQCFCCWQPIILTDRVIRQYKWLEFCLQWSFYQCNKAAVHEAAVSVSEPPYAYHSWDGKMLCASVSCQVEDLHWWLWNAHEIQGETSNFPELLLEYFPANQHLLPTDFLQALACVSWEL